MKLTLSVVVGIGIAVVLAGCRPASTVWKLDRAGFAGTAKVETLGAPVVGGFEGVPAFVFDGVDDGIVVERLPAAGWKEFTIEVHLAPAADGAEEQRFFHMEDPAGRRALIELRLDKDGYWALDTFLRFGGDRLTLIDRTLRHPAGKWHWVALRYDGRRMTSFVNGAKELEGDVPFGPFEAGQTSIGVRLNKVYWFKGAIAEVRVHPRALEVGELAR